MGKAVSVKPFVDWKSFIAAWEASENKAEVATKTGLSETTVGVRGGRLRRLGVPLKQFPRKTQPALTADAGLEILAEIRGVSVAQLKRRDKKGFAPAVGKKRRKAS
jgi:hypothetical protein